jgi:hypothetical protein
MIVIILIACSSFVSYKLFPFYEKFDAGTDEKKAKELGPIIDEFYDKNIKNSSDDFPKFYRGVCEIVEYFSLFILKSYLTYYLA